MKNQIIFTALICATGIYFNSCKKKDTPAQSPSANGELMIHLHTNADTNEVVSYGSAYVMTGGRKIIVTKAQLYISGIQLIKSDGSTYDVPGTIILKKQEIEPYMIGSVPSGSYQSFKFSVGLSAAVNASTPAPSDSTLNTTTMWFGTSAQPSGFIFVNFQGKIDTSMAANATVAQMQSFSYKIGTNTHLKNVSMPVMNFTVTPNQSSMVHLVIDYSKLFNGIQLNANGNLSIATTTDNAGALATQISNNIPLMFRYQ